MIPNRIDLNSSDLNHVIPWLTGLGRSHFAFPNQNSIHLGKMLTITTGKGTGFLDSYLYQVFQWSQNSKFDKTKSLDVWPQIWRGWGPASSQKQFQQVKKIK